MQDGIASLKKAGCLFNEINSHYPPAVVAEGSALVPAKRKQAAMPQV
jgi:hypothetical protein